MSAVYVPLAGDVVESRNCGGRIVRREVVTVHNDGYLSLRGVGARRNHHTIAYPGTVALVHRPAVLVGRAA